MTKLHIFSHKPIMTRIMSTMKFNVSDGTREHMRFKISLALHMNYKLGWTGHLSALTADRGTKIRLRLFLAS